MMYIKKPFTQSQQKYLPESLKKKWREKPSYLNLFAILAQTIILRLSCILYVLSFSLSWHPYKIIHKNSLSNDQKILIFLAVILVQQ